MEREIQAISPGALGNAMQPGQCPPAAGFVQNGETSAGGMGTERVPATAAAPSITQRWDVPTHAAHGVPWLRDQWIPC